MANSTSIKPGDEYITVAGENVLVSSSLLGYREERNGASWWTLPDGSFSYFIKTKPALPYARRRQIAADKAAVSARLGLPPTFMSLAELAADWK